MTLLLMSLKVRSPSVLLSTAFSFPVMLVASSGSVAPLGWAMETNISLAAPLSKRASAIRPSAVPLGSAATIDQVLPPSGEV